MIDTKLTDYYSMRLYGEDYDAMSTPEEYRETIEAFRLYEGSDLDEHKLKKLCGLRVDKIRKMRQTYCEVNQLPIPEKVYSPAYIQTLERHERRIHFPFSWKQKTIDDVKKSKES